MRKQAVLLSTPDNLRGRAQSGHQMAAYLANSIGQIYVAFMVSQIGAGLTMQLGGVMSVRSFDAGQSWGSYNNIQSQLNVVPSGGCLAPTSGSLLSWRWSSAARASVAASRRSATANSRSSQRVCRPSSRLARG